VTLLIRILTDFPPNVLAVDCEGRVTRGDYETVLIPAAERVLAAHAKVSVYYEIGPGFEGVEPGAVLEDMKIGMEHFPRWHRIALVCDVAWIRGVVQAFGFLMPGRVKLFHQSDALAAREWVSES
jgi:hypothetical protein